MRGFVDCIKFMYQTKNTLRLETKKTKTANKKNSNQFEWHGVFRPQPHCLAFCPTDAD